MTFRRNLTWTSVGFAAALTVGVPSMAGAQAPPGGLAVWAGACAGWRWRRRRLDAARAQSPAPREVRVAPPPPICIGVHAVFAERAYDDLCAAGVARVVTCNTIPHGSNAIDVNDLVADAVHSFST